MGYVYKQSVQNAESLYEHFKKEFSSLKKYPEKGSIVKEISNPRIREVKVHRFRIIYRYTDKVYILTIHHSARLLINNPHFKDLF